MNHTLPTPGLLVFLMFFLPAPDYSFLGEWVFGYDS